MEIQKNTFLPVYQQVAKYLRERISDGTYPVMSKLPSEDKLASQFGINRMTLRKALEKLSCEGVLIRRKGKGTFVNGKNSVQKKLDIGIIFPFNPKRERTNLVRNYYYGPLLYEARSNLPEYCSVHLLGHNCKKDYLSICKENNLDGLLINAPYDREKEELVKLYNFKIPFIVLGATFKDKRISYVDSDNFDAGFKATEYLIKLGHRKIAFIKGTSDRFNCEERYRGYLSALKNYRIKSKNLIFIVESGENEIERTYNILKQVNGFDKKITAFLCQGYFFGLGVMKTVKEKGLKIPQDISLISFDDPDSAKYIDPPMTVIKQPLEDIARIASQELIKKINNNSQKQVHINLKAELIIRASCQAPKKNKGGEG